VQTLACIAKRSSVREFIQRPIPKDKLETIVNAARLAPTARGIQPWEFVVIQDRSKLAELAALCENARFLKQAAGCIITFCRETKYYLEDGSAATENMLLAACELGLGACWVAGDKKPYCRQIMKMVGAADDFKLVSMIALGYAKGGQRAHPKRSLKEVIHWERL
jgi:nitroreductase